MGHFVSSTREREKRDRRNSREDVREEQGRKRNRNKSEETEEEIYSTGADINGLLNFPGVFFKHLYRSCKVCLPF